MQEDRKPLLNKIPFWIADAVFVVIALVIAFSGEPGMTALEAMWMVFCVVVGAAMLVIPYYVEFTTHAKLHHFEHDQAAWERVRKLDQAIELLSESRNYIDGLAEDRGEAEALASLETRLGVIERHISDIHERNSSNVRAVTHAISEQQKKLQEHAEVVSGQFNAMQSVLAEVSAKSVDADAIQKPLFERIDAQQKALDSIAGQLRDVLASKPEFPDVDLSPLEARLDAVQEALTQQLESMLEDIHAIGLSEPEDDGEPGGHPLTMSSSGSLMSKALSSNPPSQGASVIERIIKPSESGVKAPEAPVSEEALEEDIQEDDDAPLTDEFLETSDAADESVEANAEDALEDAPLDEDEDADEAIAEEVEEDPKEDAIVEDLGLDIEEKVEVAEDPVPLAKNSLGQTKITVHALIGIGNKPYLRGDGPGLSWERGIAMDFVEIGKWEWKSMRAKEPFKYQIWLNDQKPAEGDVLEVEPGDNASMSPRFPA